MAGKVKVWRVLPEFEGRVTMEQECKHVVLSNKLTQEQLTEAAKNPNVVCFMESVAQTAAPDVKG